TTIVPAFGTSNTIQAVGGKMFQGLFNLDADKKVVPVLAEAVEVSADGLEYTLKLRQGLTWHGGKPFTAADVLFNLEVVPQFITRTANLLKKVVETTRVDDFTIVLKLEAPICPSRWRPRASTRGLFRKGTGITAVDNVTVTIQRGETL